MFWVSLYPNFFYLKENMNKFACIILILTALCLKATAKGDWWLEAEDKASTAVTRNGVTTIIAPKGATWWYKRMMRGNTTIEYEARIVADPQFKTEKGDIRVSDLNCFWMADRCGGCGGKFANNYALKLYYMGYGGNWNTTTRFRRYKGYWPTEEREWLRPTILREYTDKAHLIRADHWYKIRLEAIDGRVRYIIDGECLVDYVDPEPLTSGYFGFRTTLAHAEIRNFKYSCTDPDTQGIKIGWTGDRSHGPVTFGVPFAKGEATDGTTFSLVTNDGTPIATDSWRLASWADGSTKWQAFAAVIPQGTDHCLLKRNGERKKKQKAEADSNGEWGAMPPFHLTLNNKPVAIEKHETERQGKVVRVEKFTGKNFTLRAYTYKGSKEVKIVHTLIVDSTLNADGLHELSIHFKVPMHGEAYERYVAFDDRRPMSVQPLIARRKIDLGAMDSLTRSMIDNIARWDGFRLSQLSPNGHSIRKRTHGEAPWIGTIEGTRSNGTVTVGDSVMSTSFRMKDFWQSYPSTLQVDGTRGDTATVTLALYSPEAEPYSFAHYDSIPHTLEAAYEDVQPGMSTAWGIARTSTIYINPETPADRQMLPTPEYLHRKRAFGVWSLPKYDSPRDSLVENALTEIMQFYDRETERHGWYGFFNYGDVMHAYDTSRDEWRYDVGGFAWDNTELASPAMLWYQFLRTADPKVWRMAEAMTRHCSEVDTYHQGPHAGLGSRHNVIHWGCGAKESRISEAWWNRFYYYLTADDRTGDVMHEVAHADTLLYTLDPMRLAQPRDLYPCSAPARLRIGPDWMGYASNWLTEWERTGDTACLAKLQTGIESITRLPFGFTQGPLALGYDPATGAITTDQPQIETTNHLMPIMGGFELMNELRDCISAPAFFHSWLNFCRDYKEKAWKLRKNKFRIPRLQAYAAWHGYENLRAEAWKSLLDNMPLKPKPTLWTNDCATWTLDAIFMQEVIK